MFLQFYTIWLFFLAIPGTAVAVNQIFAIVEHKDLTTNILTAQSIIYAILLAIWSTIFIERWKRKTSEINMVCSIDDDYISALTVHRSIRNEFRGNEDIDDITGYVEKHLSTSSRICILFFELLVLSCILGSAGLIFYMLQEWKISVKGHEYSTIYSMLGGTLNGFTIVMLNAVYSYFAKYFAKLENHKLETTYQQWLTAKIFVFQLINGNIALVWAGFIEQDSLKLYSLLFTIMITKQIVNTIKQLVVPTARVCWRRQRFIHESIPKEDIEFHDNVNVRIKYDGLMDDYGEMIQQFSYLINFSAAFPLAPLISLVVNVGNNIVSLQSIYYNMYL
jgi:anoctamin-7